MPTRVCRAVGILLIALGLWGLLVKHPLLGFAVNPLNNITQMIVGAAALWAGSSGGQVARAFSLAAGGVLGAMAVMGFRDVPAIVDLMQLRIADHWLNASVALSFLVTALRSRVVLANRQMTSQSTADSLTWKTGR